MVLFEKIIFKKNVGKKIFKINEFLLDVYMNMTVN